MSEPPYFPVGQAYPTPLPGSREECRIYPAPRSDIFGHPPCTMSKSFCQTYLGRSLGSRGDPHTYLVPGPDMSGPSAFPRVKSMHQTCPVPRPGSSSVFQICLVSLPDMSESLTSQRSHSSWGIKRGLHPPPPFTYLATPLT
jgi:hypothetical protein